MGGRKLEIIRRKDKKVRTHKSLKMTSAQKSWLILDSNLWRVDTHNHIPLRCPVVHHCSQSFWIKIPLPVKERDFLFGHFSSGFTHVHRSIAVWGSRKALLVVGSDPHIAPYIFFCAIFLRSVNIQSPSHFPFPIFLQVKKMTKVTISHSQETSFSAFL
jgi:hypothetical protein